MKNLAFEIIGKTLIIRDSADEVVLQNFAEEKMRKHPYIQTVLQQTSPIQGQKRTSNLKFVQGKNEFETTHKEYGNIYRLNPLHTFFSPRLSYERQRIANLVKEGDIIVNFFSGVGPFSITIASKQENCIVHSIEINEHAYRYLCLNILLNKCQNRVFPYYGDAFKIIPKYLQKKANRVLLPLPLEADRALLTACNVLDSGKGTIHWQITDHLSSKSIPLQVIKEKISSIFTSKNLDVNFSIRSSKIIRWIAPRIAHIAVDLDITKFD